jgi:hypothetical protein
MERPDLERPDEPPVVPDPVAVPFTNSLKELSAVIRIRPWTLSARRGTSMRRTKITGPQGLVFCAITVRWVFQIQCAPRSDG